MIDTNNRGTYLGDGVYVAQDGYALVLTVDRTSDPIECPECGYEASREARIESVVLEPEIYSALVQYVEHLPDSRKIRRS